MGLTSPINSENYIYMQNNSHRKPTGNWQKIPYTTKAARKIPMNWVGLKKKRDQDGNGAPGRDL